MKGTRTELATLEAAIADIRAIEANEDEHGAQRWRHTQLAAAHLASLSPERRAQLEREWQS
jgi:hypothetical protein